MKKKYIGIGLLIALFLLITILVITNNISFLDDSIYNFIYSLRNDFTDTLFKSLSKFGDGITIGIIAVILFVLLKDKNDRLSLLIGIASTVAFNQLMKFSIQRARPDHPRIINEWGYSYTSGHSAISIAVYGLLIYLVNKNVKNKLLKTILIIFLMLLVLGIGLSRIYVGVHYPSDVIGGYISSLIILILVISYCNNHFRGKINDKNGSK